MKRYNLKKYMLCIAIYIVNLIVDATHNIIQYCYVMYVWSVISRLER